MFVSCSSANCCVPVWLCALLIITIPPCLPTTSFCMGPAVCLVHALLHSSFSAKIFLAPYLGGKARGLTLGREGSLALPPAHTTRDIFATTLIPMLLFAVSPMPVAPTTTSLVSWVGGVGGWVGDSGWSGMGIYGEAERGS